MNGPVQVLGIMIPIIAIVFGIGVAFWSIYWEHRTKQLQYAERQLMIEKGLTPPPVLPDEGKKRATPEDSLRKGTIMLFLGIGCGIGYLVLLNASAAGPPPWLAGVAGAIVGLLGVGNLVYYFIARKHETWKPPDTVDGLE